MAGLPPRSKAWWCALVPLLGASSLRTGNPKGVIISHKNMFATIESLLLTMDLDPNDYPTKTYMAFLPLAHVFELLVETTLQVFGFKMGYSSPNT